MVEVSPSTSSDICVIGLGSRGLGLLERVVTLASETGWERRALVVDVVDPRCDGTGIHTPDQPDYLLLNTVCSQLSLFPDESSVGTSVGERGPSLHEWAADRGLRLAEDGYTLGDWGRPVRPTDFLPRRILGSYLSWCLEQILDRAPDHLEIRMHRALAVSLLHDEDGSHTVGLDDGTSLRGRHVFLTTGHTQPAATGGGLPVRGAHRFIRDVYPPERAFSEVGNDQSIALAGTGLSGMDALAALTLGRGGRYTVEGGKRRYVPSGREPRILLYTRTGLPFRARPVANREGAAPEALVFTREALDRMRAFRPSGRLNTGGDLLPLLYDEMRLAFHRRCAALLGTGQQTEERLRSARDNGRIGAELASLDRAHAPSFGEFHPRQLLFPEPDGLTDSRSYQEWYLSQIRDDLREAALGLAGSPRKAGLEVLRDHRETLRYAVDFGGLDDTSHQEFYGDLTSVFNRAVIGPQLERHEELTALVRSGVVSVPLGPAPRAEWNEDEDAWRLTSSRLRHAHGESVDWLCLSTSAHPELEDTSSPLLSFLMDRETLRRHRPSVPSSRGVDITSDHHPIGADGTVHTRMWVLGPLCEGTTFYNHYVPSPGAPSRALRDAHHGVVAVLESIRRDKPAPSVTEPVR